MTSLLPTAAATSAQQCDCTSMHSLLAPIPHDDYYAVHRLCDHNESRLRCGTGVVEVGLITGYFGSVLLALSSALTECMAMHPLRCNRWCHIHHRPGIFCHRPTRSTHLAHSL